MVNHAKMIQHEENIKKIDKAIRRAHTFPDKKAELDLGEGQKLLSVDEMEKMRVAEVEGIKASRL